MRLSNFAWATCVSILVIFGIVSTSYAQVGVKEVGQSTMTFLKVSASPKAAGMGNARTSLSTGSESMFRNPAGLAGVTSGYDLFVSNTQWIADINHRVGALATSLGNFGTVGINVRTVDYGDITRAELLSQADPKGYRRTGTVDVGAYAVGVGYARQISSQFSMGVMMQYVTQSLGQTELEQATVENEVSKLVGNFGMKYFPGGYESFRFAMSIRHFSTGATYEEVSAQLPVNFHFGVGIDLFEVVVPSYAQQNTLLISADFLHPNDYTERVNVGGEYSVMDGLLSLSGGYEFNYDVQGLSGGFGIAPEISDIEVDIDYSYSEMEFFSGVNRFSLGLSF